MFNKYSGEIAGILIAFLGAVLPKLGVPVLDTLPELVQGAIAFVGLLVAYVRRVQRGDVSLSGFRK